MSVQFILGRPGFLLYPFNSHCVAWWGILESSIRMTCPNHLSLRSFIMSSSFHKPVFFLMSSFFTLSFMKFSTICVGTYDVLPLVSSSVEVATALRCTVTLTKRAIHIVWLLSSDLYPCFSRYSSAGRRHLMLSRFFCCTLCHSFHCSIYGSQVTEILDHFDFCTLGPQYSRVFPAVTDHNLAFRSIQCIHADRPTYPDIFSTSSGNFCMPVCEVSMRAISSAKSKSHNFLPFVYSLQPSVIIFQYFFQYPVQHCRKQKPSLVFATLLLFQWFA